MALVVSPISSVTYLPPTLGVQAILGAQRAVLVPETPAPRPTDPPAPQLRPESQRLSDSVLRSLLLQPTATEVAAERARERAQGLAPQPFEPVDPFPTPTTVPTPRPATQTLDVPQANQAPVDTFEPPIRTPTFPLLDVPEPARAPLPQSLETLAQPASPLTDNFTTAFLRTLPQSEPPLPLTTSLPALQIQTAAPQDTTAATVIDVPQSAALETPQPPIADVTEPALFSALATAHAPATPATPLTAPAPIDAAPAPPTVASTDAAFTASLIRSAELAQAQQPVPADLSALTASQLSDAAIARAAQLAAQPALGDLAEPRAAVSDIPIDAPLLDPLLNPALEAPPGPFDDLPLNDNPLAPPLIVTSPQANAVIADLADAGNLPAQDLDIRPGAVLIARSDAELTAAPVTTTTPQATTLQATTPDAITPDASPAADTMRTAAQFAATTVSTPLESAPLEVTDTPFEPEGVAAPLAQSLGTTAGLEAETVGNAAAPTDALRIQTAAANAFSPMMAQYQAIDAMQNIYVAPNGLRQPGIEIPAGTRALTPPPIDPIRQVAPVSPVVREIRV